MKKLISNNKLIFTLLFVSVLYMTITGHSETSSFVTSLILWLIVFFLPPIIFWSFNKSEKVFRLISIIILILWFLLYPLVDFIM